MYLRQQFLPVYKCPHVYVSVNSNIPPPGKPPGIRLLRKIKVKFPGMLAVKVVKCPTD